MPSPFPGMDPYIELVYGDWPDFHTALIAEIGRALNTTLPPGYRAAYETRELLEVLAFDDWGETTQAGTIRPDIIVRDTKPAGVLVDQSGVDIATAGEVRTVWQAEPVAAKSIRIVSPSGRPTTEIELLSPSNKSHGRDRASYLRKKQQLLASDLSFVEIDLLIGGERACSDPAAAHRQYGTTDETPFVVAVYPAWERDGGAVAALCYPTRLDQTLPTVRIPVEESVGFVAIDLQECFTQMYEVQRFALQLDYERPLPSRLPPHLAAQCEPFVSNAAKAT